MKNLLLILTMFLTAQLVNAACEKPSSFSASNITSSSANLSWSSVTGTGIEYRIRYKKTTIANWTYVFDIPSNTFMLNGLDAGVQYQVEVGTQCGEVEKSGFTQITFYTNPSYPCTIPSNLSVSGTTNSTTNLTWNAIAGTGVEYLVRYKVTTSDDWFYIYNIQTNSLTLTGLTAGIQYQVEVGTECDVDNLNKSGFSPSVTFYTAPNYSCTIPSNFQLISKTSSSANLTWQAIAGTGVEYLMRYKKTSSANWIYIYDIPTNSRTITGLDAGSQYQVQVGTECDIDNVSKSGFTTSIVFYTSPAYPCTTPTNLLASSITSSSANLTWSNNPGAQYLVRYKKTSSANWIYIFDISTNSRILTGLDAGIQYQVQVGTECDNDNVTKSGFTSSITFYTSPAYSCTIPSGLTASSISSSTANLSWTAIIGTGVEYLMRYKKTTSSNWVYIFDISTNSRILTGLDAGSQYQVQVGTECNVDNTSNSGFTSSFTFYTNSDYTCSIPTSLSTSGVTTNTVQFNWSENAGAEYLLRYKEANSPSWIYVNNIATNSYSVNPLDSGTLYTWQVRTECSIDNQVFSGFSIEDSVLTDYGVDCDSYLPLDLVVDSIDFKRSNLSWSSSTPFSVYNVRYRSLGTPSWTEISGLTDANIELTNLNQGTTYYVGVQLDCSNDYVSLVSSWSDSVDFETYICQAPTGISGTNIGENAGSVSWNPVPGADSYNVLYSPKSAPITDVINTSSTNVLLSSLYAGTVYRFEVQTVCSTEDDLISLYSTSLPGNRNDFTTSGVSICQPPANFSVSSFDDNSITLGWVDSGADSYIITTRASYETVWTPTTTTNPSSYTVASLDGGTLYRFRISAVCESGNLTSTWSGLLNQSTSGTSSCTVPKDIAITNITSTSAEVDWTSVAAATSYTFRYKLANSNNWIYDTNVGSNYKMLTSLTSSNIYAVQVSSNCSGETKSLPSESKVFTTLSGARSSVDFLSSEQTLSIYPNPTQDLLSINISEEFSGNVGVEIYSSKGTLVKSIDNEFVIDVSDLSSGIYHLVLTNYATNQTDKLSFSKID